MDQISEQKLKRMAAFLNEAKNTTSSIAKKQLVGNYTDLKDLFGATYNYDVTYGLSDKLLSKEVPDRMVQYVNLDHLLEDLASRRLSGHDAVYAVQSFTDDPILKDALYRIVQKDLKVRVDYKLINSVIPNCVKHFDVTLAERLDKVLEAKTPIDYLDGSYFASRKYDGVRLVCLIDTKTNTVHTFSREGREYTSLQNLFEPLLNVAKAFQEIRQYDGIVVTDGEAALATADGSDDFKGLVGLIKRFKDGFQIANPRYNIFDILTEDEFYETTESPILTERYEMLKRVIAASKDRLQSRIVTVEQTQITSQKQLDDMFAAAQLRKEEGLILRKNIPFETGRSKNMLKVKKMHHIELKVIDVEFGDMELVDDGVQRTEKTLSRIVCEYEGGTVRVGSGFKKEERRKYFRNPELLIGKMVTVQYFEKTTDRTGTPSLRFPIFCAVRDYE